MIQILATFLVMSHLYLDVAKYNIYFAESRLDCISSDVCDILHQYLYLV